MGFFVTDSGEHTMKKRFLTKTTPYVTFMQPIDIEEYDEYWDKIIRAASRRLRKKLKDQQTREFSESDIQEGIAELNDGIRSKNQVTQVC